MYADFLSQHLLDAFDYTPIGNREGLCCLEKIPEDYKCLLSNACLQFICELYDELSPSLELLLQQRKQDRDFIDKETLACVKRNQVKKHSYLEPGYETVIGKINNHGDIVIGPMSNSTVSQCTVAPLPEHLQGFHVTLFGPPNDPKMAINAMNCWHRQLPNEPAILTKLVEESELIPKLGSDVEDSVASLEENLRAADDNLNRCFHGDFSYVDEHGKTHIIKKDHVAQPIKRIPGLALPNGNYRYNGKPLPMHLMSFAIHLFHNWKNSKALTFYIPKLETEQEAAYIHNMIARAEEKIQKNHPEYQLGSVRVIVVLENARAIFRTNEIIDALYPYFAGASLGWHDFLASTARIFKEDPNYRIPVKTDSNIVIDHIRLSHLLLRDFVGARGGLSIGGMYGVLPIKNDAKSLQETIIGYFRDVITQLKRGLDGFWVAHPDFVRLGIAIVSAWKAQKNNPKDKQLFELVCALISSENAQQQLWEFIQSEDISDKYRKTDPRYSRALLAADILESNIRPNNDPDEVYYNLFQTFQYLLDYLQGNGCVAVPAYLMTKEEKVNVRVMDDLATTERSRWEVWATVYHNHFKVENCLSLIEQVENEIIAFRQDGTLKVHIRWDKKWGPVARNILIKLVTDKIPVEFVSELLLPFTLSPVRKADSPWAYMHELEPEKYSSLHIPT